MILRLFVSLLSVICFLSPTLAYATANSSYKIGFGLADFTAGNGCNDTDSSDCETSAIKACIPTPNSGSENVTNQTACVNGFVDSWRLQCKSNLRLCAIQVLEGVFPGHMDDNKSVTQCYKYWDGNGFDVNTLVLPKKLSTDQNYKSCPPLKGKKSVS
jgi:hypothetical protein